MKKQLLSLLSVLFLTATAIAGVPTALDRAVLTAPQNNPLSRLIEIIGCLQQREKCTVLDWPAAARYYNQAQQAHQARKTLLQQYHQQRTALGLTNRRPAEVPFKEEYIPGAVRQLPNVKFYFIGEVHKPEISALAHQLIRHIHQELPEHSRVLLATEFVLTYAGDEQAMPLRKPKQITDLQPSSQDQAELFALADELNMDILSLDDKWLEEMHAPNGKLIYPVKVGNFLVEADTNYGEVDQVIARTTSSTNPVMRLLHLRGFFLRSIWGIEQRNAQWARYLKALEANYDAIIVYAGEGHLDPLNEYTPALPQLLELTRYARLFVHSAAADTPAQIAIYGGLSNSHSFRPSPAEQLLQETEKQLGIWRNQEMYIEITVPLAAQS